MSTPEPHSHIHEKPESGRVRTRVSLQPEIKPADEKTIEQLAKEKRAEDIAYTINHAISCGTLDLLGGTAAGAYITDNVLKKFHHKFQIGCGHNHGFWSWFKGEFVGDVAAVLPTIAVQHYAPSVMTGLRYVMEPTVGWVFRGGANRSAYQWAKANGLDPMSQEVKDHAEKLYEHEVSHLPHAALWTLFSIPISAEFVNLTHSHHDHGHGHGHHANAHGHSACGTCSSKAHLPKGAGKWAHHWKGLRGTMVASIGGKILSSVVLLGARAAAPETASKWDKFASETVYYPATLGIGSLFGVSQDDIDRAMEKHHHHTPQSKVQAPTHEHEGVALEAEPAKLAARG